MTRPLQYRDLYVVLHNLPYLLIESSPSGIHSSGGVLGKGQRVWMKRHALTPPARRPTQPAIDTEITAFAEELGIILLDPHLIARLREPTTRTPQ